MSSPHHGDHVAVGRAAALLRGWAGLALPERRWSQLRASLEALAPDGTVDGGLDLLEAGDRATKQIMLAGVASPETYLFRHPVHFEILAEHAQAAASGGLRRTYRVLSAGCATGEEAWSAAAVLDRVGRTTGLCGEVTGWDLNADWIARARAGEYSAWSARNGFAGYDQAFEARKSGWRVHPRLRSSVSFECVNLKMKRAPGTASFDVVFLRNVAIYWAPDCAKEMIVQIANLVNPGGLLLLGASEPEALDRTEWTVEWRDAVRVAARRPSAEPIRAIFSRARERAREREKDEKKIVTLRTRAPVGPVGPVGPDPLDRVRELADRGRYVEALSILDDLTPTPEPKLHLWRGILCLNIARPVDALACMRKAVFLAPCDVACRHWLAAALSACGRHEAATREHRNLRELCE